jgi:hypothetical protein
MMLIFVLLLCINVRAQAHTFKLTPADAEISDYTSAWEWKTDYEKFDFDVGETKQFAVDLSKMTGTKNDGQIASLTDHYSVTVDLDTDNQITGYFKCSNHDDVQNPSCNYASECNPSLGTHTFQVKNIGPARQIGIKFSADADDAGCALAEAVADYLKTVLIIIGVCFALCICFIVLGCMGVISCCCFAQKQPKTQVIMMEQPNAGRGTPDMTPYNAGLQPGWEAKWDANTQKVYWVNHNTQTNSWVDPRVTSGV